jgi:hypothetical protein
MPVSKDQYAFLGLDWKGIRREARPATFSLVLDYRRRYWETECSPGCAKMSCQYSSSTPFYNNCEAMSASMWTFLIGIALLLIPIPPFATIAGGVVILFGIVMKILGG